MVALKRLAPVLFLQVETVMVGLERLWHSGVIPGDWDTAAFGGSGDMVSAKKQKQLYLRQYRTRNQKRESMSKTDFIF